MKALTIDKALQILLATKMAGYGNAELAFITEEGNRFRLHNATMSQVQFCGFETSGDYFEMQFTSKDKLEE